MNTTSRMDNCTACTTAKIINQVEGRVGEDAMTANQIERSFGYTGKEREFSFKGSLNYVEDATGLKGSPVGFNEGEIGHYAVFPRKAGAGFGHVMYGEVLPNGSRYEVYCQWWTLPFRAASTSSRVRELLLLLAQNNDPEVAWTAKESIRAIDLMRGD